jgi:hypothetical protein
MEKNSSQNRAPQSSPHKPKRPNAYKEFVVQEQQPETGQTIVTRLKPSSVGGQGRVELLSGKKKGRTEL